MNIFFVGQKSARKNKACAICNLVNMAASYWIAVISGPVFVMRGWGPGRPHGTVKATVVGDIEVALAPTIGQGRRVDDIRVGVDPLACVALLGGRKLPLLPKHRVLIILLQVFRRKRLAQRKLFGVSDA